ncbi:MAG: carboxypeptidase regulatory-like domain-containing protein [Marinicellaceae bacterium]
MKKFFTIWALFFIATTSLSAQKENSYTDLLSEIQSQLNELNQLIEEVGREKIGDIYFQKLTESKAALAQLKAEPIEDKEYFEEINHFYFLIDNIFHPDNEINNQETLGKIQNRGSGDGVIRGIVTHSDSGEPADNVFVRLYDSNGNFILSNFVDSQGRYAFENIANGQYTTVAIAADDNEIDTATPDISCLGGPGFGCDISDLPLFELESGQVIEGINISIRVKPTISGRIFDLENPNTWVRNPSIKLSDESGILVASVDGNYTGEYELAIPQAGNYYISVEHSDYQTQLYDGVLCSPGCPFVQGTLISFENDQHITDFNFNLTENPQIKGTHVDSETLSILSNGRIYLYNEVGQVVGNDYVGNNGYWYIEAPIGHYYLAGSHSNNYIATLYDEISCPNNSVDSCTWYLGDRIFHSGSSTPSIEFKQIKGGSISGFVYDANNNPISNAYLKLYNDTGTLLNYNIRSQSDGSYEVYGLNNGSYYLVAESSYYQDELYPDIACANSNCSILSGNQITINDLDNVSGIDFFLNDLGSIKGRVIDHNSDPISSIRVYIRDEVNEIYDNAYTSNNGEYTFNYVENGSYKVYVSSGYSSQYKAQAYNLIECADSNCENSNYTPVVINENDIEDIDFKLNSYASISFNLSSNSTNPVNSGRIYIYDENGEFIDREYRDSIFYLDSGNYYFVYEDNYSSDDFVYQVYGGANCERNSCVPTTGQLVNIANNTDYQFNMDIDEKFYIDLNFNHGSRIAYTLYDENYSQTNSQNIYNNSARINVSELDSSNIYIKFSSDGFHDQLFDNIDCSIENCNLLQATPIIPVLNSSQTISANLTPIASISGVIKYPDGSPASGINVYLLNDPDSYQNTSVQTSVNGEYIFDGIDAGEYYIKTQYSNNHQYATTYFGNIACYDDCQNMGIPFIHVGVDAHLENQDITLISNGFITGENIFNTHGEYTPSVISIYRYNQANEQVLSFSNVEVNSEGKIAPVYLPEGAYKMTIREADGSYPYLHSAYPDTICDSSNSTTLCANMSDPIEVITGIETHFNGFILHQLGQIRGVITDSSTGDLISSTYIKFYKELNGQNTESTTSDNLGIYKQSIDNGRYKIMLTASNHINELYNGIRCYRGLGVDCQLSQGESISIAYDEILELNFELDPNPLFKVNYQDKATSRNLASKLKVYDIDGYLIKNHTSTTQSPSHVFNDLVGGQYYVIAEPTQVDGHLIMGYPDIQCLSVDSISSCDGNLSPISVSIDNNVTEVTIGSYQEQGINGYVKDAETSIPLGNIVLDFWDESGAILSSTTTSSTGGFSHILSEGEYYISTDTNNEYKNEVYQDVFCDSAAILGDCDVTQGQLISVPDNNVEPIVIDINLTIDDIFANSFE